MTKPVAAEREEAIAMQYPYLITMMLF